MQNENGNAPKGSFLDALGMQWTPEFTTPVIKKTCQRLGVDLEALSNPTKMNIGNLIEFLWYSCEEQATERGIDEKEFYKRASPARLKNAGEALFSQVGAAFPGMKDMLGERMGLATAPKKKKAVPGN